MQVSVALQNRLFVQGVGCPERGKFWNSDGGDRRQKRGGLSARRTGGRSADQMLRLRTDLRPEATPAIMGADEIAGNAGKSAGCIHVGRR